MDGLHHIPQATPTPGATDWHRPLLRELAELAMDAARRAHATLAATPTPPDAEPDATQAQAGLLFTRLARTVRQTIALDARLAAAETTDAAANGRRARTDARRLDHRRTELRRRLARAIRDSADPSDAEALLHDLDDRIDDDDIHAALDTTPIAHLVHDLCVEWGIPLACADWTDEELEAAIARDDTPQPLPDTLPPRPT